MIALLGRFCIHRDDEPLAESFVLTNARFAFEIVGETEDGEPIRVGKHAPLAPDELEQTLDYYRSWHEHVQQAEDCPCSELESEWIEAPGYSKRAYGQS